MLNINPGHGDPFIALAARVAPTFGDEAAPVVLTLRLQAGGG